MVAWSPAAWSAEVAPRKYFQRRKFRNTGIVSADICYLFDISVIMLGQSQTFTLLELPWLAGFVARRLNLALDLTVAKSTGTG